MLSLSTLLSSSSSGAAAGPEAAAETATTTRQTETQPPPAPPVIAVPLPAPTTIPTAVIAAVAIAAGEVEEPEVTRRTAWSGQPDAFVITLEYRMPMSIVTLVFRTHEPVSVQIDAHGEGNHVKINSRHELSFLPVYDPDTVYRDLLQSIALRPEECTVSLWTPKPSTPTSTLAHIDHMHGMAICNWPFQRISTWKNWWYTRQVMEDTLHNNDDDDDDDHFHHHRHMVDDVHGPVAHHSSSGATRVKHIFEHMVKTGKMTLGAMCKARVRRLRLGRATELWVVCPPKWPLKSFRRCNKTRP